MLVVGAIQLPDNNPQSNPDVVIFSPVEGQIIKGIVEIIGTSAIAGFEHSELAFSNSKGQLDTWFLLSKSSEGVVETTIYTWDTSLITDGDYRLRLKVFSEDGSSNEFMISEILVRNYTPTLVSSPTLDYDIYESTQILVQPTETPEIKPTDLPGNPLELKLFDITKSMLYGFILIIGLIGISFLYSRTKR